MQGLSGDYNFRKLAFSTEAIHFIFHAKILLLLILIETLDLGYTLQMVHNNTTFRFAYTFYFTPCAYPLLNYLLRRENTRELA